MGNTSSSSGKYTFKSHPAKKSKETKLEATDNASQENASAHVNGGAKNHNDVPMIDEPTEPTDGKVEELNPSKKPAQNGSAGVPNGDKKKSNPFQWVQHRVSKSSLRSKGSKGSIEVPDEPVKDETAAKNELEVGKPVEKEQKPETPVVAEDTAAIEETSSKLVQYAIESSEKEVIQADTPVIEVSEDKPQEAEPVVEEPVFVKEVESQPLVEAVAEPDVFESDEKPNDEEASEQEIIHEVLDTNNTNSALEESVAQQPEEQQQSKTDDVERLDDQLMACHEKSDSPPPPATEPAESLLDHASEQ